MVRGECNCGAVSYSVATDLSDVFVCHCSICRRATGSNGIAVVVVSNDDFNWTGGKDMIKSWKKPGADWEMWFCQQCGSPVPGINDESRMYIPAGSLVAGADSLTVAHHIWVDSKARWDVIGDSGRQHPQAFKP